MSKNILHFIILTVVKTQLKKIPLPFRHVGLSNCQGFALVQGQLNVNHSLVNSLDSNNCLELLSFH